jgi:hypothetical protein
MPIAGGVHLIMRSWGSVRRSTDRQRRFPGSHGPSKARVDRERADLPLMPRRPGFLPDVATPQGFHPLTATRDRTAGSTPACPARTREVVEQLRMWIAGSSPMLSGLLVEEHVIGRRFELSCPGLTQGCPINLSCTIGLYGAPTRWSMRSWESVRPCGNRRRGFPRSHGPSEAGVDRDTVNLRLKSRCAGFLPDVGVALAFGPLRAKPKRTAVGLTRQSTARSSEVVAPSRPWIAGSRPTITTWGCCRARHAQLTIGCARHPDSRGSSAGVTTLGCGPARDAGPRMGGARRPDGTGSGPRVRRDDVGLPRRLREAVS